MSRIFKCISILTVICLLCVPFVFTAGASGEPAVSGSTYILGDADGDGAVTIVDATMIQRILAHLDLSTIAVSKGLDPDEWLSGVKLRGDGDRNGVLESIDATLVQRFNVHLIVLVPIGEEVEMPTEPATQAPTQAPTQKPTSKPDPYELPLV